MLKAIIVHPKSLDISGPPLLSQKPLFSNSKADRLSSMEGELKSILVNTNMDDDKKYALYNSLLADTLQLYNGDVRKTVAAQPATSTRPALSAVAPCVKHRKKEKSCLPYCDRQKN